MLSGCGHKSNSTVSFPYRHEIVIKNRKRRDHSSRDACIVASCEFHVKRGVLNDRYTLREGHDIFQFRKLIHFRALGNLR